MSEIGLFLIDFNYFIVRPVQAVRGGTWYILSSQKEAIFRFPFLPRLTENI